MVPPTLYTGCSGCLWAEPPLAVTPRTPSSVLSSPRAGTWACCAPFALGVPPYARSRRPSPPSQVGGSAATVSSVSRWLVSLNRRRIHRSPVTTRWEIAALSEPPSANGREPVAIDEDLADDPAVGEHRHALVRVGGRDALDGAASASGELVGRLGVGDHVPALLVDHPDGDRVGLGDLLAEQAALPVAQAHLVQVGVDDHRQVERVGQRLGRLGRAAELRHVDRVDALAGQPGAHLDRLLAALGRELRVAVAVDEVEGLPDHRRSRLAVAHEDQLGGARAAA